jgi:hypothetical protein
MLSLSLSHYYLSMSLYISIFFARLRSNFFTKRGQVQS